MLQALAPVFIAVAAVLAGLLSGGRDHRHGREVFVMFTVCVVCAALGALGAIV